MLTTDGALGRICPYKPVSLYGNTPAGHYQSEMEKSGQRSSIAKLAG